MAMTKVSPFHSTKNPGVYHVSLKCTVGNKIEKENKAPGTGGGTLCLTCKRLQLMSEC